MSVAIIVQLPRLSTAARRRTITFRFPIRDVAMESATVIATGSPSGMAETARATARKKTSVYGVPCAREMAAIRRHAPMTRNPMFRENFSILTRSGGFEDPVVATASAIVPTSVFWPVATTTPMPRPVMTVVPAKVTFPRSPIDASASASARFFLTATDSPVSSDSSTVRLAACMRRRSAGTRIPDSRRTMSPGTMVAESTSSSFPPRLTCAVIRSRLCRRLALFSAFHSCTSPITAFKKTTARMKPASL